MYIPIFSLPLSPSFSVSHLHTAEYTLNYTGGPITAVTHLSPLHTVVPSLFAETGLFLGSIAELVGLSFAVLNIAAIEILGQDLPLHFNFAFWIILFMQVRTA